MEWMTACGSLCPYITALGCLTRAKAAWRRLSLPFGAFFWPGAAFASLYRLYTDASSTIYLCGVLYRFWSQNTCTNVYYASLARWNCSDRYRASWAHSASRERRPERGRQASTRRLQEKNQTIVVQESLWSQKQNCSIRCGMSYASNT